MSATCVLLCVAVSALAVLAALSPLIFGSPRGNSNRKDTR